MHKDCMDAYCIGISGVLPLHMALTSPNAMPCQPNRTFKDSWYFLTTPTPHQI
ncbi:uncharacterized protein ACLA_024950 [Aspergillus clavatus NRRL 1]|uniref:Uncharacterized protein n=1 Tax=Aspergillus clavatus (strain ATCC 1007 / CBS 513.65 / DSM 816 / NCTC 3887 / NRRL 1 / QM 1276 / 107) TaxID=344612 RepID=A1CQ58_ASPCL|nr:uncharacterized protein ACLA_024950 [Aspergillus clavatus NRRL 1]EAW07779.1 hypothetical protein ACLA_024950 [Aspergillus clavatus NRRL 1]